jgi:hypothetical protein
MCWIDATSPAIWFFVVPVLLCLFVNICLFIHVMRSINKEIRNAKTALKATITFTASLGLTNIFGAMIVIHDSIVWQYALALSLGFQGVAIFYFHCWQRLKARKVGRKTSSSWGRRTLVSPVPFRFGRGAKKQKKNNATKQWQRWQQQKKQSNRLEKLHTGSCSGRGAALIQSSVSTDEKDSSSGTRAASESN